MSGKGPCAENHIIPSGKIGQDFTTEEGYQFARRVGINMLATLKSELGSLSRVQRVIEIQGIINADPNFTQHHIVLNGLSDFFIEIFGENGKHARSVLGANSLRDNLPLIATGSFLILPE
jgi:enamine deaminase RidA (YjgF/YER057c/UK114 family)